MRLPLRFVEDVALTAGDAKSVIAALGEECEEKEKTEIGRLFKAGLPPVTSVNALAVMTGYNPGFVWAIRSQAPKYKYYRVFQIPKGRSTRQIEAPRVALKILQKWLSVHFEKKKLVHEIAHGFVPGRSHLSAAILHTFSEWVASVDIESFFPSTPQNEVRSVLTRLGYETNESLSILESLCCYRGRLAQGAPTSPVLSNLALYPLDGRLSEIAAQHGVTLTRYADDIVFSGKGTIPEGLLERVEAVFEGTPWKLSKRKRYIAHSPGGVRGLRVHGLLVHGDKIRLTKRYRNRIRLYRYLNRQGKIREEDVPRIGGHLNYAAQIENMAEQSLENRAC